MKTVQDLSLANAKEVYTINSSQTVYQALLLMAENNVGALPVLEEKKLVGIISERDYARKVILKGASSLDTPVKKIMSEGLITASPQTSLDKCLELMSKRHIRHLPILEKGKMVDFISIGDLINIIMADKDRQISELSK